MSVDDTPNAAEPQKDNAEAPSCEDFKAKAKSFSSASSSELTATRKRLDDLVGEAHWLSVGNYKESLIRNLLEKRFPKDFEIGTGFVFSVDGANRKISKQLDVLIWDSARFVPFFRDGDFVIVPPEACRAVVEVKSTLDSDTMNEAMENLLSLDVFWPEFVYSKTNVRREIFAFTSEMNFPSTVFNRIWRGYRDGIEDRMKRYSARSDLVESWFIAGVSILGKGAISIREWSVNGQTCPVYAAFETVSDGVDDTFGQFENALIRSTLAGQSTIYKRSHPGTASFAAATNAQMVSTEPSLMSLPPVEPKNLVKFGSHSETEVKEFAKLFYVPR